MPSRIKSGRKLVSELQSGDIIDPPAHEKQWLWKRDNTYLPNDLKPRMTVAEVRRGQADARGEWLIVVCDVDTCSFQFKCKMRPGKTVTTFVEA